MNLLRMTMSFMSLMTCLALGTYAPSAHAQDLDFQEYRKFLMSGDSSNKKLAIQTTCTSADGEVHRIGEEEYDTCLDTLRNAQQQKKNSGGKSESLGTSQGVTIRLGE